MYISGQINKNENSIFINREIPQSTTNKRITGVTQKTKAISTEGKLRHNFLNNSIKPDISYSVQNASYMRVIVSLLSYLIEHS